MPRTGQSGALLPKRQVSPWCYDVIVPSPQATPPNSRRT